MSAALYVRISKDPLEEGAGVDRQEKDCRRLLAAQGFSDPVVFRDNDRSAWQRNRKRPAWDDMLTQVRSGQITTLAVWHPDRLMRQPRDLEDLLDAAERGLRLLSAGGGRDLSNPDDRFVLRIEVAAACKASDDSSRRIRRVFDDRATAGLSHGGTRPFGLTADRTALDHTEAAAVRRGAEALLAGASLRSVCADFEAAGLVGARGSTRWAEQTVRGLLLRPSVAGFRTHRGQIVGKAAHPAVLDEGTWRAVVDLLTDPARRESRTTAYRHLLSGLLHCSRCGDARMRSLKQTGSDRRRYACPRCFRNAASEPQVDAYVEKLVADRLDHTALPQPTSDQAGVTTELAVLRRRLEQVTREFADDPDISPTQLRVMTRRLNTQIRALEAQVTADAVHAARGPVRADWRHSAVDGRRMVVASMVERIDMAPAGKAGRVFDPGRLTITWR